MFLIPFMVILLALTVSCSSATADIPKASSQYRRDILITFEGQTWEGVAVLPKRDVYKLTLEASGNLDLFRLSTCHRDQIHERAWNVERSERWLFFKRKITDKNQVQVEYRPTDLERSYCPLEASGYEEKKGRHSWAFIDFESDEAKLAAVLLCNGSQKSFPGVSICQAREGLLQEIRFGTPVKVSPAPGCEMGQVQGDAFKFSVPKNPCVYRFKAADGQIHRLTVLPYNDVILTGGE